MFKLPVCPYCHAVNGYKDVKKSTKRKVDRCHHCNRMYRISYLAGRVKILLLVGILLVVFNLIILYTSKGLNLQLMLLVTMTGVIIAILCFPFTVKYKSMNREEIKKYTKKKNQK